MPSPPAAARPPRRVARSFAGPLLLLALTASACRLAATSSVIASSSASPGTSNPAPSAMVAELPAGFPIMPGALEDPDPPAPVVIGAWHTDVDSGAVYDYYLAELPAAGFAVDAQYPGGGAAIIVFSTPAGDQLQLALEAAENGGTDFQVLPPDPR